MLAISPLKVRWCQDVVVLGMCFVMVSLHVAAWLVLVCEVERVFGCEIGPAVGAQVCGLISCFANVPSDGWVECWFSCVLVFLWCCFVMVQVFLYGG